MDNTVDLQNEMGEVVLYKSEDGQTKLDVHLKDNTVWLNQAQMVELFQRDKRTISEHIRNVFKEGELIENSVIRKSRTTAADGKSYKTLFYNLDVIISVGYRIKSLRGTQFRIWSTTVLKDYIIRGYSINQRRIAEKGANELRQVLKLLSNTLTSHQLVGEEGTAILEIINRYAKTWELLLQYDEDRLPAPDKKQDTKVGLDVKKIQYAVSTLKKELMDKGEASGIFGNEHGNGLSRIIGAIQQTFDGQDLYPGFMEKAANLLYFIIKDHPFTDGNKRIGSFLFLYFLGMNGLLAEQNFDNKALVALALLIAASDPRKKDLMIRLVVNLISEKG